MFATAILPRRKLREQNIESPFPRWNVLLGFPKVPSTLCVQCDIHCGICPFFLNFCFWSGTIIDALPAVGAYIDLLRFLIQLGPYCLNLKRNSFFNRLVYMIPKIVCLSDMFYFPCCTDLFFKRFQIWSDVWLNWAAY